jgi:DNA-directed RNA polymerase sigma subunit (sigma70/sigma32)
LSQAAFTIPDRIKKLCWQFNSRKEESSTMGPEELLKSAKCRLKTKQIIRTLAPSIFEKSISLDVPIGKNDSGPTLLDTIQVDNTDVLEQRDIFDNIRKILKNGFTPRERLIIYFMFPTTSVRN